MLQRAITIFALALLVGSTAVGQTAPVIDGQTGAVTITPQTLEWLRRQLAEEEDRLRQLQVAIRQIERALAASQVTAETLIPPPGSQAMTEHSPAPAPELPVVATPILPPAPRAAIVPRPPFTPPLSQSQTPHTAPIAPAPVISTPSPIAATPSRVVPSLDELASSPVGTAPPVAVATPPSGDDLQPAPASSRPPRIMIPTFAPRGAPGSAASGVTDEIDRSGSPVPLPPGAEGDEPIEFLGIPGASATTGPLGPLVAPLRAGLTMAQVRQIKGTPALIRRDDASGTEVWTYDDTTLTFRGGRLDAFRIGAAEVAEVEPVTRRTTAKTPAAEHRREPVARLSTTRIPERQRLATNGSATEAATECAGTQKPVSQLEREPTRATSKASESRRSEWVARWRGSTHRTRRSWRSRRAARAYYSPRTTGSHRSARAARQYRLRRWARQHQRSHRWALRNQPEERRAAIMAGCRKCRIAQRYLQSRHRSTSSRVASWRSTTRVPRQSRSAKVHQVKIIQRR